MILERPETLTLNFSAAVSLSKRTFREPEPAAPLAPIAGRRAASKQIALDASENPRKPMKEIDRFNFLTV